MVPVATPAQRDPYRSVIFVLLGAAWLGAGGAGFGGRLFALPILLVVSLTLALAGGVLVGIAAAQMLRAGKHRVSSGTMPARPLPGIEREKILPHPLLARFPELSRRLGVAKIHIQTWLERVGALRIVGMATSLAGAVWIDYLLQRGVHEFPLSLLRTGIAAGACLIAAGLAATASRYLAAVDADLLPESAALRQGARVIGWILTLAAFSMPLAWAGRRALMEIPYYLILAIDAVLCIGLFTAKPERGATGDVFPLHIGILSILGSRGNILASILDSAERQLGIDIRSTWALTVVRRGVEPLLIGLCFAGWLSTSFTVVAPEEQGLIERLGVPVSGESLMPGMHLHFPWPVDRVFRVPAQRVQMLEIGHEGEEPGGPENVLWARKHAENEYTLLLGNGRDLITVDAAIQYRIRDVRAWRYNCQNPADALRAVGYRAVMRDTVGRTLSGALSENVATLTSHMRSVVQQDADALGLGVDVLGFTVGGMHPPVSVAADYQAVVSAELRKVTVVVNAQVYRNLTLPQAEAAVLTGNNTARAEGTAALAKAAGEAWSFRTLQSQYRAAPAEYFFRRRLEALEKGLAGRHFTVVDSRFERDGGQVWVIP